MVGRVGSCMVPGAKIEGDDLPRRAWCTLNRLRTGHGRCALYNYRCGWIDSPACHCGAAEQSIRHIIEECPTTRYTKGPIEDLFILNDEAVKWIFSLELNL